MKQVYDPNSSLKLSMGLPPIETSHGRIDLIMDVKNGKVKPTTQPAEEFFYKAYNVSFWTMPQAAAAEWLNTQFGTNVPAPEAAAPTKPLKIAFFVSDLSNVFHQAQAAEAQKYAKEKYGAEVFVFDGKADSRCHDPERRPDPCPGHGWRDPAHLGLRCSQACRLKSSLIRGSS